MYLAISIALAAAGIAEAAIQARKVHRLRRSLECTEEQLLAFEKSAKCMEESLKAVNTEKEFMIERANRLDKALHDGENAACTLRRSLQNCRAELRLEKDEHERAINELSATKNEIEQLKKERRKLEEALMEEHESAAHWHDECKKEYFARLTTEGRVAREWANMLSYDGTSKGQKDADEEEYPYEY